MTATEPIDSERLLPVTWPVWMVWVLTGALIPVLESISATAELKRVSPSHPHHALIVNGLLALVAFTVIAPPILQGFVLKRVVPKLSVGFWFGCVLLSCVVSFLLATGRQGHGPALIEIGFRTQGYFQSTALTQRLAGALDIRHILSLPWAPLLLWTIATSALTSIIPAWALGSAAGRRRATMMFLAAAIVGACAATIVEQFYKITVDRQFFNGLALNGLPWTQRFELLAIHSGVGAVWGAASAIIVVLTTRRLAIKTTSKTWLFATYRPAGLSLVLAAPVLIACLAAFAAYLAGPRGLIAGAPDLRKALSLAPSQDRSQGETVLTYSHDVAVAVARTPAVTMTPDGQSAIVRTANQTLMQVDLATGRGVRQLADALAPLERHAIAWSLDGRSLALRSNGAEMPIPNSHYKRHQSRVRLYSLPNFALIGEFSNSEGTCFDTYAREPMLFSNDSRNLWLVCGQYFTPKPDDLMAIRLDVPTMQVLDLRHYGEAAKHGRLGGLERAGDSAWAWQFPYTGQSFRVRDLTHDREIAAIAPPVELIGQMTAQPDRTDVDEKTIRLTFCGTPPGTPADAGPTSWICRTLSFDTPTGALLGRVDSRDNRVPKPPADVPRATTSGHGLRIEWFWQDDSKTGEIVVRDSATGRERQRIVSIAQRPLQMSADGRWLMTLDLNGTGLRLYRVQL